MSCETENIDDRHACVEIIKDKRQDLLFGWKIEGMPVAEEFMLTLFSENKMPKKKYLITPEDDTLIWNAPDEDINESIMYYEMIPTVITAENWIKFSGKITSRK